MIGVRTLGRIRKTCVSYVCLLVIKKGILEGHVFGMSVLFVIEKCSFSKLCVSIACFGGKW